MPVPRLVDGDHIVSILLGWPAGDQMWVKAPEWWGVLDKYRVDAICRVALGVPCVVLFAPHDIKSALGCAREYGIGTTVLRLSPEAAKIRSEQRELDNVRRLATGKGRKGKVSDRFAAELRPAESTLITSVYDFIKANDVPEPGVIFASPGAGKSYAVEHCGGPKVTDEEIVTAATAPSLHGVTKSGPSEGHRTRRISGLNGGNDEDQSSGVR